MVDTPIYLSSWKHSKTLVSSTLDKVKVQLKVSRIDFYLLSPGLRSSDFAGVLCTVVQTMCVVVNDDPWLDCLGIAHDTASDVLVRAFGCHSYLPAQHRQETTNRLAENSMT